MLPNPYFQYRFAILPQRNYKLKIKHYKFKIKSRFLVSFCYLIYNYKLNISGVPSAALGAIHTWNCPGSAVRT